LFSESDFSGWSFKEEEESKGKKSENGILNSSGDKDGCCTKRQRVEC
jgi:U3 small nucleolar RNA-associated protein 19